MRAPCCSIVNQVPATSSLIQVYSNGDRDGDQDREQTRRPPARRDPAPNPAVARPASTTADIELPAGVRRVGSGALVRVGLLLALLLALIGFIVVRDWRNGELGLGSALEAQPAVSDSP